MAASSILHNEARSAIADYALIGNLRCAALVSRSGDIDWFCPPRFDAPACFAALLGHSHHGHWSLTPADTHARVERAYAPDTLVLETCFHTRDGSVRVTDCMPVEEGCKILRRVEGLSGRVPMHMVCRPAFDYGRHPATPELHGSHAVFRREGICLRLSADLPLAGGDKAATVDFDVAAGEHRDFVLCHCQESDAFADPKEVGQRIAQCGDWWRQWVAQSSYEGRWPAAVTRSLITLKASIFNPTGGMVAAPTTSLPEIPGGQANWDYRFCWPRDATLVLDVLLGCGCRDEARAWRDWLLQAVHGEGQHLRTLYTLDGRISEEERELPWLPGFHGARPVRAGNAASKQYQLDVRGELIDVLSFARHQGLKVDDDMWAMQKRILSMLDQRWCEPDPGIWEFRDNKSQLTHSKAMCWMAYDRSIRDAEKFGLKAPLQHWRAMRDLIREEVLRHGVHSRHGYFTQAYGNEEPDASLLMLSLVGFLPADDPRIQATVAVIEKELSEDGLVWRNRHERAEGQGCFLPCCFWLADNYCLAGRWAEARALFERLLGLCNDVGLLAEEYDPHSGEFLGNFPQSLSHLALINSARLIGSGETVERS